jgi:acyl-homoserine-lactone acylase
MKFYIALAAVLMTVMACGKDQGTGPPATTIHWDSWGVPHVFAENDRGFFFADGWSQMHAHANTILRLYGASRGRAAEYWGEGYLPGDRLVHTLNHPARAESMWTEQDPELRAMISAFVEGMNAYAKAHPEAIDEENRVALPVTPADVNLHTQFVVNARFVAGKELETLLEGEERGSNTIAIGPSRSAEGRAMLVQNPHLPWDNEFLFFEKHAVIGDRNITGVHLAGLPGFAIAFNQELGWSHTNNTIDNADLYDLELSGEGYLFGGAERTFEKRTVSLKVKTGEGAYRTEEMTVLASVHGPVVNRSEGKAQALRFVGGDSTDALLQWWRMSNARDFREFESALKLAQIPFWNVMYADRAGNIFYLFNGHVPVRENGDWAFWQSPVPGSEPEYLWNEVHGYDALPKLLNPETGWLQNANDPPWTSTIPALLEADHFPAYMAPREMAFRPQRAVRMILEDASISFEELVRIKHDTRMEMADRLLDDLFTAVDQHGTDLAREAAGILRDWDRKAEIDSRGAVLFANWALNLVQSEPSAYAQPWDEDDPLNTPDGLSDPARMAGLLDQVAGALLERHGRLDIAWGEFNRIRYNGHDLPANGSIGELGVFRVAAARPGKESTQDVIGGDTWVAVIQFGEIPRAKVLLSYGNSTQPGSPHYGDQLELFSRKEMRDAWRTIEQLDGRIEHSEVYRDGRFVEADSSMPMAGVEEN